jgi:hypothetical protein
MTETEIAEKIKQLEAQRAQQVVNINVIDGYLLCLRDLAKPTEPDLERARPAPDA